MREYKDKPEFFDSMLAMAIEQLVKDFPNDAQLGEEVRKLMRLREKVYDKNASRLEKR